MVDHPTTLTDEMRSHFLTHGYVKITNAIPQANVEKFTSNVWTRLGWDRDDPSTWVDETVHMPRHREIATKEFMPTAYAAACASSLPTETRQSKKTVKLIVDQVNWWGGKTSWIRDSLRSAGIV